MDEDQLEKWIIQREREHEVRSRIIPASADRLTSINPGDGEAAMESVAAWLGGNPQLPIVEIARISPRAVTLTFSDEVVLPEPWVSALSDRQVPHDQWGVVLPDALELPRDKHYGWQVSGLTGIGTLVDGSRGLINTCRWEILQIAGTPKWTQNLILTQIMNQAAEPWSAEHDLWLVGFGETADKLMNFLSNEHPVHRFHVADSLEELDAEDLRDASATIYVLGADRHTELQFQALQTTGVGLVADSIITDQAMFLTEREGGQAVLGPFRQNLEIWPNLSAALIEKMEQAWVATEEIAKQKAAEADFDAFLTQQEHNEKGDQTSDPDFVDEILSHESPIEPPSHVGTEEVSAHESVEDEEGQVNEAEVVDDEATLTDPTQEHDHQPEPEVLPEQDQEVNLQVFGPPTVFTPKGDLTGRNAALLVILNAEQEPVAPQAISEMLWPGDEATGHTARTRRSRLRAKVHQHTGEIIQMEEAGWVLQKDVLRSDFEAVLNTLINEPISNTEKIVHACQMVSIPLEGMDSWAEPYRVSMTKDLLQALNSLKYRAVEAEEFDTAKAAKAALVQLGEA